MRASAIALDFRSARDLKEFADELAARRATLTSEERYYLARALEECQFVMSLNEDLTGFSARQRRQFLGTLTPGDPVNARRISAYDASDNTQLRIGPNGETPEAQSFLGAFTLVVCDFAPDCVNTVRERDQACAYGGYCNAGNFEEIYQNYIASPWQYTAANRYRDYIHTAINSQ